MKRYFDAAATTPMDDRVKAAIMENIDIFGNENSKHARGFEARKKIDQSLAVIADVLGTAPAHLAVTYSGTDANRRFLWACRERFSKDQLWASAVEHSSVTDEILETNRFDPLGNFKDINPNAKTIAMMAANSETGTIFSAEKLREKFPEALILRDYAQAVGKIPVRFDHADAISFAPQKLYGPKMVGLLWLKQPQSFPEISKDSHTKNVWLIAGMAKAFEILADGGTLSGKNFKKSADFLQIETWQQQIETFIEQTIPNVKIRHAEKERCGGILNVSFKGIRGGELATILSQEEKICVSTGSACTSDILSPTPVIQFFEPDPAWQFPVRISLHKYLDQAAVDDFCEILAHYVAELRKQ